MKKIRCILSLILAMALIYCKSPSSDSTPTTNPTTSTGVSGAKVITSADLPLCNESNDGYLYYVTDIQQFKVCSSGDYVTIDLTGNNGDNSLVAVTDEPAGVNCSNGGKKVESGLDINSNGTLEAGEITSTSYVCNGEDGSASAAGLNSIVKLINESAGANCTYGGKKIEVGLDDNSNTILDITEVDDTFYVCNGSTGATGPTGDPGVSIIWLGSSASAPVTCNTSHLNNAYYNSTDKKSYICDGTNWQIIAQDGQDMTGDTTPPTGYSVSFDNYTITNINDTNVSIHFYSAEVGSTYYYTIISNQGGTTVSGSGTVDTSTKTLTGLDLSGLNDGNLLVYFYLVDSNNNVGPTVIDAAVKRYPTTCKEIKVLGLSSGDGIYTIDVDGLGEKSPIQVYCDMTTSGGGWTLIFQNRSDSINSESCGSNLENFLYNTCGSVSSLGYTDSYSIDLDNMPTHNHYLIIQYNSSLTPDTDDAFIINFTGNLFPFATEQYLDIYQICDINMANCDSTAVKWFYTGDGGFSGGQCNHPGNFSIGPYHGEFGYCHNGFSTYSANSLYGNRSGDDEFTAWGYGGSAAKDYMKRVYVR